MEHPRLVEVPAIEMAVAAMEAMATKAGHQIPARDMVAPTQVGDHRLMEGVVVLPVPVLPEADRAAAVLQPEVAGATEILLRNMAPDPVSEVVEADGAMETPLRNMDPVRAALPSADQTAAATIWVMVIKMVNRMSAAQKAIVLALQSFLTCQAMA